MSIMRILIFHVNHFSSTMTEKGRSKVVEKFDNDVKTVDVGQALLVFTSVEKEDETNPYEISVKTADEIAKLANQLKVKTIVIHSFAHLFGEMSKPEVALETLKLLQEELNKRGFEAVRTPFGWFNTLEISAKGHPLSRISRKISLS